MYFLVIPAICVYYVPVNICWKCDVFQYLAMGKGTWSTSGQGDDTVFPGKRWEMKTNFLLHLFFGRAFPQAEVMFSLKQCES